MVLMMEAKGEARCVDGGLNAGLTKEMTGQMGRRTVVVLLVAVALAACCAAAVLSGCAASSQAAESASRIAFADTLASDYQIAQEAVSERADDAKLLAVKSSTYAQAGAPAGWTFLFVSRQRASAYTVTVDNGQAKVADNPTVSLSQEEYDAIPAFEDIAIDAQAAYERVVEQLDETGRYVICRASLTTYAPEDEDPSNDALTWYFSFNSPDDFRGAFVDTSADLASAATYAVDAVTGEVTRIA